MTRSPHRAFTRRMIRSSAALAAIALAGCAGLRTAPSSDIAWHSATQMVLVTTADWDANTGSLRTFTRDDRGSWRQVDEATPVTIGRSGSGWGLGLHPLQENGPVKREGDGRSPAGVFAIGQAFGYAEHAATALSYAQMQDSSWCMDVVASPLYNRIVDAKRVGDDAVRGSSEPMRLDLHNKGDQRYRSGFVIEQNPAASKGAGSCIFAHLWKAPGETTAGCTAMADTAMERLYGWLRPDAHPVFVLLPQAEYEHLKTSWNLPL